MAVSAGASKTGVPMTAHSADCGDCDTRVALVPGRRHDSKEKHPIYGLNAAYPRQHSNRSAIYKGMPDVYPVLAEIPEASYTYGVWEVTYGLINEAGLSFGESSCDSKISAGGIDQPDPKTGEKGPAMLSIAQLMTLGLERCKSAQCAIRLMGAMAERYGFYGESFMGGEALTISDVKGESWVFHVLQDHSTNASAVWAAQRVPEGHVAAIANEFIIKEIPQEPHPDFLHSKNMHSEAKAAGLWNGEGEFNFRKVFGTTSLPTYGSVRLYGIFFMIANSLNLPYNEDPFSFPFSVPVDEKLSVEDLMNVYRTHYNGTEFDMTKGILAGYGGNINRIEGGDASKKGAFTRGISIPRTAYTHIGYSAPDGKACSYFGVDQPTTSVFVPLLSKTLLEARSVPLAETTKLYAESYQVGKKESYEHGKSAWWAFDIVSNWMNINYQNMSEEYVYPTRDEWQTKMFAAYQEGTTSAVTKAQEEVVQFWWSFFDMLIVRYNDGMFNFGPYQPKKQYATVGYRQEYLDDIFYDKTFYRDISVHDVVRRALDNKTCPEGPTVSSVVKNTLKQIPASAGCGFKDFVYGLVIAIAFFVGRKTASRSSDAARAQSPSETPYYRL
eukprot:CAMPEP_0203759542 /NCGR_PEP_ID=MMETSP0098-20131031/12572_1 /ASSEMBLY_ACC=CAM_ASM_000208 /TAXON_ID=96639 /ORGANISM=" , Strain NY0313808BC1" /LENGTH=611 /DNA_ID=CAMNT_0050652551 /DNA_START=232 /DNA_END=2067 /DNA_ORIENTATION=-